MRVVFDTNVLVAAGRSSRGASNRLLSLLPHEGFTPVISPALYLEYLSVLLRPENVSVFDRTPQGVTDFVRQFLSYSHRQRVYFKWRPMLRDPDDDFVLELAINAGCSYVITFNKKDFAGCEFFGIKVLSPSEFLYIIESL